MAKATNTQKISCTVVRRVKLDGEFYNKGESVELGIDDATELVKSGAVTVKPPAPQQPQQPPK